MTTFHFQTTVLPDGTIPLQLPEALRGIEVEVALVPAVNQSPNNGHWKTKKTLDQLTLEQGDKRFTNPNRVFGTLSFLWNSPEEVEEFLEQRKNEI
jgi:hypothetical protein